MARRLSFMMILAIHKQSVQKLGLAKAAVSTKTIESMDYASDVLAFNRLNAGCGQKKLDDAVNLDITPDINPDVLHDLNEFPWPLPSNHFREVFFYDVIEHLEDIVVVMEEIYRICRGGAAVHITVPHFSCSNAFTDPTHRHYFGYSSFEYFTGEHEHSYYSRARFRHVVRQIVFSPSLLNKVLWRIANRWPQAYERRWAWTFPAWFLSFKLQVVKDNIP